MFHIFHKGMVTCMVLHVVTRDKPLRLLQERYAKPTLSTLNKSESSFLHSDILEPKELVSYVLLIRKVTLVDLY